MLNDDHLAVYFKDHEQVKGLIVKQKELLVFSLHAPADEIEARYFALGTLHHEMRIPLSDIVSGVEYIRKHVFRILFRHKQLDHFYERVDDLFDTVRNSFSRGYFKSQLKLSRIDYTTEMSGKIQYRVHIKWVLEFIEYLESDGILPKPHLDHENSIFQEWLTHPQSEVIFRDSGKYEEIIEINRLIHRLSNSIIYHFHKGNFYEAYSIFKEFSNKSSYLIHTLNMVLINFFNSKEERFFKHIFALPDVVGYLSVINIRKLAFINKYNGVDMGDHVIMTVDDAIKSFIVGLDDAIVYTRLSDGEFYIFYPGVDEARVQRLQASLKEYLENLLMEKDGYRFTIKTAFGTIHITDYCKKNTLNKLLHYVMIKAKERSENIYYLSDPEQQEALDLIDKASEDIMFVQKALLENNLEIFFQPIYDLSTGKIYDVEALARIKKGDFYITAGAFIELIYELDVIIELDIQILRRVMERSAKIRTVTANVFINVSPQSLKSKRYTDFLHTLLPELKAAGLEPVFELTEQSFLENIELVVSLHQEFGITFAVDDFGTGYSSLRTVADLAEHNVIRFIKIDGSIVKNIVDSKSSFDVLDATSYMTKKLKLLNIAEFIENEEILEKVKSLGITHGQGFHLCKPMGIDDLLAFVAKQATN
jgi:EAL domain-containing protein (putative c-di-GMP-specific phosphodiesterase class I)/GGDEF domain-containing protein